MQNEHTAILSLGSNLGDRAAWLSRAAAAVAQLPGTRITARSSLYETEPVDVPAEHADKPFLNAVLIIATQLDSEELSVAVHTIEDQLERSRETYNSPRTIDIDIIAFDREIRVAPKLTLPHPGAIQRRFVLQPLAEIAPDYTLPGQKKSVSELLEHLPESPAANLSAEQWSQAIEPAVLALQNSTG